MTTEPKRLRLGSDALAAGLASLQQAQPSEARLAALAARLADAGAPVEGHAVEAPSSTFQRVPESRSSLRLTRAAKVFGPGTLAVLVALVFGGGLIATAILIRKADTPLVPARPPALPIEAQQAVGPATPPAHPLADAPAPSGAAATRGPEAGDAQPQPTKPPEVALPVPAGDAVAPSLGSEARLAPPKTAGSEPSPASPSPAEPAARVDARPAAPSTRAETPAAAPGPEGAPLAANTVVESEVDLLKQARSALSADPLQAFALSERCRAQYPGGAFAQEREYIAISALVRLGRDNEARSRASLFRMHYPNSAYLPRLARMLGE